MRFTRKAEFAEGTSFVNYMSSREEHLLELYVIMSQKSNIKCFFKKAQDIDPDPVVDLIYAI